MKKSFSCLLILLVISSLTLTLIPSVKSQTEADIKILNYSCYVDSLGYLTVVGEVQNKGSNVIDNITIAGLATSTDGTQTEAGNIIWGNNLLPGQKAPFYIEFISQSTSFYDIESSEITLKVYHAVATNQYQYPNVIISSQQGAPKSNGEYWIHGELKNVGTQTATNVAVIGTFYNSAGIPIAVGYKNFNNTSIAAGTSTTFDVPAFDLNQTIVSSDKIIKSYSLLVQVKSPKLTGAAPVINETSIPIPGGTVGPSNVDPSRVESDNSSGNDQNIMYAAVIAVAIVAVIVALVLIQRRKSTTIQSRISQPKKNSKKARR
jgi:hypothetical protein